MTSEEAIRQALASAAARPPPKQTNEPWEQALQQAQAEGLTLRRADNTTGYHGVYIDPSCKNRPYQTQVAPTSTLTLTLAPNPSLTLTLAVIIIILALNPILTLNPSLTVAPYP